MMKHEVLSPKMSLGIMITLLKPNKRDKGNPDNYRGMTLLPVIYKLFERITLARMHTFIKVNGITFPDPLQGAYQKSLSSVNVTFSIQETIKYNRERGSKVIVCLMDHAKAFDLVWHTGLFVKLNELGICNKLWRLIINAYSHMSSSVLYKGQRSHNFDILQSSRQGSLWGAFFYLVLINPLIIKLRELDCGAYIGDMFSGVHAQADDLALIATTKQSLQKMMNCCYSFSCMWRFMIHPQKSKILVCGETKRWQKENSSSRVWKLGLNDVPQVESHTHCGILLTSAPTTIERTKLACRKGRGIMRSICKQAALGDGKINPLTAVKLYKVITLPSALFGCEVWTGLSHVEKDMLERLQRFCVKVIQNLPRQTRSNICCQMLGLHSVEGYIDNIKLKFFRRVITLKSSCTSKQILLRRIFQASFLKDFSSGFGKEVIELCEKYNLGEYLNSVIEGTPLPDKTP